MATETGEIPQVAVETFPKKKSFFEREWVVAAVLLAPFMILFLVFRVYPVIQAIRLSFDNVESIGQSEFIGLGNYQELLADERFLDAVGNNALYTLGTLLLLIPIPLALAALLFSGRVKGAGAFRTILFVPLLAGLVVVAVFSVAPECRRHSESNPGSSWDPRAGMAGDAGSCHPVADPSCTVALDRDKHGLLLGRAGRHSQRSLRGRRHGRRLGDWRFFSISVPLSKPIILFVVVLTLIGGFQLFTEPYVLYASTAGPGPIAGH